MLLGNAMKLHLQGNPYLPAQIFPREQGEGNSPSIWVYREFPNLHENLSAYVSVMHSWSFFKKKKAPYSLEGSKNDSLAFQLHKHLATGPEDLTAYFM
jgi:hypothetical protein